MVDHVFTIKTNPEYTFFSRKFSMADMTEFSSRCFLSHDVVLEFSGSRPIYILYKATRFLQSESVESRERDSEKNNAKERVILRWFVVEY